MTVTTSEHTQPSPAPRRPHSRGLGRTARPLLMVLVLVLALVLVAAAITVIVATLRPAPVPSPLVVELIPPSVGDAIPGQRIVLLATFTADAGATDPATVGAATTEALATGVTITVAPDRIGPGEVAEVTVVVDETVVADLPLDGGPMLGVERAPPSTQQDTGPVDTEGPISPIGPEGVSVPITVTVTRGNDEVRTEVPINVSRGEDHLLAEAARHRDRFVAWLEAERPELGITASTEWEGTTVQPHILVVSHYLFFSEDWELSVLWHIMIAPHDWSRISLRPRDRLRPTHAFEIPSVSDPVVVEIEPPAHVDR